MFLIPIIISIVVFRSTVNRVVRTAIPIIESIKDANYIKVVGNYDPNIEGDISITSQVTETKKEQKIGIAYFAVLLLIAFTLIKK
jgi:ribosomal protein S16